jgi:RND family efflux transporter MFP subunit
MITIAFQHEERTVKAYHIPFILFLLLLSCGRQDGQTQIEIAAPVTVEEVSLGPIEEFLISTGTVEATRIAEISSEAAGTFQPALNPRTRNRYTPGDAIKKDEVLATLENTELVNSIKIDSQKMNLELLENEYETQKSLYEKGGVTFRELKNTERSLLEAKLSYENSLIQLSRLKIVSPMDGILVSVTPHTPGIKINSGTVIAQVKDYRKLTLDVSLPEKQLSRIRDGLIARITNVNLMDKTFTGRIAHVSPALDASTRMFTATIEIDNPALELKPGMFVKAEIVTNRQENVVVISKDVITYRRQEKMVFVVESGVAVQRTITTGLENPEQLEVVSGLNAEDRLVVKGFETLRDRAKVKVTE